MLSDCNYNKVKLLHELSELVGFLEKYAIKDAKNNNHPLCGEVYKELRQDLHKHIDKLSKAIDGLSKENKFKC